MVDIEWKYTVLFIGPYDIADVEVIRKLWQIKNELDGQLWQRLIARYVEGQQ